MDLSLKHTIELVNPQHDDLTARILSVLGTSCVITDYYDDDGELMDVEYEFPDMNDSLLIQGEDTWGVVVGAWMHNKHLILVAKFGDDGDYYYSPTTTDDCVDSEGHLLYTNLLTEGRVVRAVNI